jgi:hypothetical protein
MSNSLQTWASHNAKTLGRNSVAPLCLLLTLVYFGSTTHGVWDVDNLLNVAGQAAPLGIVAIARSGRLSYIDQCNRALGRLGWTARGARVWCDQWHHHWTV